MLWFLLLLSVLPGLAAVVNVPVANLHREASTDTDVVSQAIYATRVEILEERDGWARVRTPDEYTGWMRRGALSGGRDYAEQGKVATVRSLFAHVYAVPNVTRYAPLLTVPFEARLEVMAEPGDKERWLVVRLIDDRIAWVQRGDVTTEQAKLDAGAMLALSRRFLGLPYTWGGTSSYGYDCSGFTQMLYRQRGYLMPRDAGPQMDWERFAAVERAALQPGDLLYFGREGRITHTGLFLGGGEFIHATTHGEPVIQISRLEDPHWSGLFQGARRLKEESK